MIPMMLFDASSSNDANDANDANDCLLYTSDDADE